MLCKHEVVGSIPIASTIARLALSAGRHLFWNIRNSGFRAFGLVIPVVLFDSVDRKLCGERAFGAFRRPAFCWACWELAKDFLPGLESSCRFFQGRAMKSKSDEFSFRVGFCLCRDKALLLRFSFGEIAGLSLDVTDFVGSSVLRAFGECLGAQRR